MRILLVLMFGLILAACGQDYEEVYGVRFGGNISEMEDFSEYVEDSNSRKEVNGKQVRFFYKEDQEGLFKSIYLSTTDGVIDYAEFYGLEGGIPKEEMLQLVGVLSDRWGPAEEYELGWAIPVTRSDVVGFVELQSLDKEGAFNIIYSKEMPEATLYTIYREENSTPKYDKETFKSL